MSARCHTHLLTRSSTHLYFIHYFLILDARQMWPGWGRAQQKGTQCTWDSLFRESRRATGLDRLMSSEGKCWEWCWHLWAMYVSDQLRQDTCPLFTLQSDICLVFVCIYTWCRSANSAVCLCPPTESRAEDLLPHCVCELFMFLNDMWVVRGFS